MYNFLKLWLSSRDQLALAWKLVRDSRVPWWKKVIPILPIVYIFSPINLATLAIPILGSVEGIVLLNLAIRLFIFSVDDQIVLEYQPAYKTTQTTLKSELA